MKTLVPPIIPGGLQLLDPEKRGGAAPLKQRGEVFVGSERRRNPCIPFETERVPRAPLPHRRIQEGGGRAPARSPLARESVGAGGANRGGCARAPGVRRAEEGLRAGGGRAAWQGQEMLLLEAPAGSQGHRPVERGRLVVARGPAQGQIRLQGHPLRRRRGGPNPGAVRGVVPCGRGGLMEEIGGFVHLHVRSGFSYGFGVATPYELVEQTARMGIGALALTDRDGLYGVPKFLGASSELGVSPIVGAEVSMEGGGHLVLLAESMEGYRSLCRLLTRYRCNSEDRRKPLCSLPVVLEHAVGLLCLTGAVPFGYLPRPVLSGKVERAAKALEALRDAFGDNLYAELTDDRTAGSRRRLRKVALFAERHGIPALATNEVTYLRPADHRLHEVLVAATSLTALPGPEHRTTDQLYLKPLEKMENLFKGYPEALRNAASVAERCAGAVDLTGEVHLPSARIRGGETAGGRLARLALEGAKERYGHVEGRVRVRLRRELRCIDELGFAPYFLVAREAAEIARGKGIPVTGRGSAASSLVSYCLGLTQPEPFSNRLLFERFIHEFRADTPDIDLDLCSLRRDEVRDELARRYKEHGVAVAATAQTMSLRGAVRVGARALGHAPCEIDELSRHVPTRFRDRDRVYNPLEGWQEALAEPATGTSSSSGSRDGSPAGSSRWAPTSGASSSATSIAVSPNSCRSSLRAQRGCSASSTTRTTWSTRGCPSSTCWA